MLKKALLGLALLGGICVRDSYAQSRSITSNYVPPCMSELVIHNDHEHFIPRPTSLEIEYNGVFSVEARYDAPVENRRDIPSLTSYIKFIDTNIDGIAEVVEIRLYSQKTDNPMYVNGLVEFLTAIEDSACMSIYQKQYTELFWGPRYGKEAMYGGVAEWIYDWFKPILPQAQKMKN